MESSEPAGRNGGVCIFLNGRRSQSVCFSLLDPRDFDRIFPSRDELAARSESRAR